MGPDTRKSVASKKTYFRSQQRSVDDDSADVKLMFSLKNEVREKLEAMEG